MAIQLDYQKQTAFEIQKKEGQKTLKQNIKTRGLILGTAFMMAVTSSGPVFAAKSPAKAPKVSTEAQKDDKKAAKTAETPKTENSKDEKNELIRFGKITKVEKDKLTLEEVLVIPENENNAEQKADSKADGKKAVKKSTAAKEAAGDSKETADFESATMKWKASGKTLEIVLDKETSFFKEVEADKTTDKKSDDKKAADKTTTKKAADKTTDEKTEIKPEEIKAADIKEGMLVKIVLKEKNSTTASEILVLSGIKEKPADNKNESTDTGEDWFVINSIKLYETKDIQYNFEKKDHKHF